MTAPHQAPRCEHEIPRELCNRCTPPRLEITNRLPFSIAHHIEYNREARVLQVRFWLPRPEADRLRAQGVVVDTCAHGVRLDLDCLRCQLAPADQRRQLRGEM